MKHTVKLDFDRKLVIINDFMNSKKLCDEIEKQMSCIENMDDPTFMFVIGKNIWFTSGWKVYVQSTNEYFMQIPLSCECIHDHFLNTWANSVIEIGIVVAVIVMLVLYYMGIFHGN